MPKKPEKPLDLKAHTVRTDKAWAARGAWQPLYDEAYEFAIPYRRPSSRDAPGTSRVERLFDSTAIASTFRSSGQLQQDLFPPGQPFFKLRAGPVARKGLNDDAAKALDVELQKISDVILAFFSSEWDEATQEMCVDLQAGTGCLLTLEGEDDHPVRDMCIPFDECAIEIDGYGKVIALFWKSKMSARQIKLAYPEGKYPDDFEKKYDKDPERELTLNQDWWKEGKQWRFAATIEKCEEAIAEDMIRTKPFVAPRYYRVPGEAYGRGPILLALPTIKTLNKAVELTLKAAAIEMMGLWGYRPGGAFNPDTVRFAPGAFWPMSATGGVMGPDVMRLNSAAGKIDVANLITQEMRMQVQAALHDDRIPEKGKTPSSATEIMARLKRISETYLGAFGRLVNEIIPDVVRRRIDILYRKGLLQTNLKIDELLVQIDVISPMASALKANSMSMITDFMQLLLAVKGRPEAIELILKVDDALEHIGREMGVPPQFLLTSSERKALQQKLADAAGAAAAAQAQQQQALAQQANGAQPVAMA
jgi:hypothetical protein